MLALLMHASMGGMPLRQVLHPIVTVAFGSAQTAGIVVPIPPHAVKQGDVAAQMQLLAMKLMNFFCESGLALAQHIPHTLSVADGAGHAVQSDASAQVSPPVPVELVPEPVAVVFELVVVVFEPLVVVIAPVVAPPLPAPPLPPVSPEVLVVVSSAPQAATATIDRTIAPNAQDFMLMPPTTS